MKGLTSVAIKEMEKVLSNIFDKFTLSLLGIRPNAAVKDGKTISFLTNKNNMMSLFFDSLNSSKPNKLEKDTLATMLKVANGYVDELKQGTITRVVAKVDFAVRDKKPSATVQSIINKEIKKAQNHLKIIANAESNKAVNTGTALQITKIAQDRKEDDPTVFFVVTKDDVTGFYEYILHTLDDKITPRLWKLSEVQSGYYENGQQYPTLTGLHVNCRCRLTYLAKGYTFKNGKVAFKALEHDEFAIQRAKHGLPKVPKKPKKKHGQWVYPKKQ